ncbi:hypothetical protein Q7P37_002327 [Cladosporium fusiforme]
MATLSHPPFGLGSIPRLCALQQVIALLLSLPLLPFARPPWQNWVVYALLKEKEANEASAKYACRWGIALLLKVIACLPCQAWVVSALRREKEGNEAKAKRACQQKVYQHHLDMEVLEAEFQWDWQKHSLAMTLFVCYPLLADRCGTKALGRIEEFFERRDPWPPPSRLYRAAPLKAFVTMPDNNGIVGFLGSSPDLLATSQAARLNIITRRCAAPWTPLVSLTPPAGGSVLRTHRNGQLGPQMSLRPAYLAPVYDPCEVYVHHQGHFEPLLDPIKVQRQTHSQKKLREQHRLRSNAFYQQQQQKAEMQKRFDPPTARHPAHRSDFDIESSARDSAPMASPTSPRRNFLPEQSSQRDPTVRDQQQQQQKQIVEIQTRFDLPTARRSALHSNADIHSSARNLAIMVSPNTPHHNFLPERTSKGDVTSSSPPTSTTAAASAASAATAAAAITTTTTHHHHISKHLTNITSSSITMSSDSTSGNPPKSLFSSSAYDQRSYQLRVVDRTLDRSAGKIHQAHEIKGEQLEAIKHSIKVSERNINKAMKLLHEASAETTKAMEILVDITVSAPLGSAHPRDAQPSTEESSSPVVSTAEALYPITCIFGRESPAPAPGYNPNATAAMSGTFDDGSYIDPDGEEMAKNSRFHTAPRSTTQGVASDSAISSGDDDERSTAAFSDSSYIDDRGADAFPTGPKFPRS